MQDAASSSCFRLEQRGSATVVHFTAARLVEEAIVADAAARLDEVLARAGPRSLVLDCAAVTAMASFFLAKLMALHRTLRAAGGTLALCGLTPQLVALLQCTRLDTLLRICASEAEALNRQTTRAGAVNATALLASAQVRNQ